MRVILSRNTKTTIFLIVGLGLFIGIVLRLVTQASSSLLFTLAVGFSAGLLPIAILIVAIVSIGLHRSRSTKTLKEQLDSFALIVTLGYIITFGGVAGLFGLFLAVFMLGLDIIVSLIIDPPFASRLGWVLSGALYGVIWGMVVITWLTLRK